MAQDLPVSHNLFFFRLENYEDVKKNLGVLFENKAKLLALGDAVIGKMFEYVDPMYEAMKIYKEDNIFDIIDMSSCAFLSAGLIKEFVKDPANTVIRDRLSVQLSLVGASTLNFSKPDLLPYTYEEIIRIVVDGDKKIYNDFTFLYSLRTYLEINEPDDRIAAIFSSLDKIDSDDEGFTLFYWNEALSFSLSLQLVWRNFYLFDFKQQEFILKNYFYLAVVSGVPVDYWLKMILSIDDVDVDGRNNNNLFLKSAEVSSENLPINTVTLDSKKLIEVFSEYVAQVYGDVGGIRTLVQEKFIRGIYGGQLEEKKFSFWLRNLLQIYYSLRSGEYLLK